MRPTDLQRLGNPLGQKKWGQLRLSPISPEHLSPRYLFVIVILAGLLLFLPAQVLAYFGTDEIAKKYRGWIAIAFAFCVLLPVARPIENGYRVWAGKRNLRSHIRDLPKAEFDVLQRAVLNRGRGIRVIAQLGEARSLEKKEIFWQSGARDDVSVLFNITPTVHSILKESEFSPLSDPDNVGE